MSTDRPFPSIDGFEFTEELGRGGMATVYAAKQIGLGRQVAIKVVHPQGDDAEGLLLRLENEAQALAGLHHPHIVSIFQFGRTREGALYYVMPLLRGGDLTRWALPVAEARVVELIDDLLDALAHAHGAGIVHRDIKPENILFDLDQRAHLADFGAALRPSRSRLTHEGMVLGSTGYMSPEQARSAEVDARSDLYSLAVVAFELLTGRLPFNGPDALSIALAQCEQPVPRLPKMLMSWQGFFDQALSVTPERRFASAEAMRLAMHARHRQIAGRGVPAWLRAPTTIGLITALLLGGGYVAWQASSPVPGSLDEVEEILTRPQIAPADAELALQWLIAERSTGRWSAQHDAQAERLLEGRAEALRPALLLGDPRALLPLWQDWRAAVRQLGVEQLPSVVQRDAAVEALLQQSLQNALADYDLATVGAVAALLEAGAPVAEALHTAVRMARALPAVGAAFEDTDGPALILLAAPTADQPGLAIMQRPVDDALHQQFNQARGRSAGGCIRSINGLRACIEHAEALALARWLSQRSGARYRLPSRDELLQHAGAVEASALNAWTSTCHQVTTVEEPKRAARMWGKVKSVFGGEPAQPTVERSCQGYYTVALDGSNRIEAREAPGDDTSVVLLREVPWPKLELATP
jgi:hypothetical protein